MVTGLQTWLPNHDMLTWGWRIPLLLSAPFGLVALFMRLRLEESPAYQRTQTPKSRIRRPGGSQLRRTVVEQWKPMLICAALVYTSTAADYMLTGYLPTYLKVFVHVRHTAGLAMITATLTILTVLLVFVATLSDRIGVKPIMWTGCVLLIAASIPAFLLIRSGGGYPVIFIGVLLIGLMELCFDSTSPADAAGAVSHRGPVRSAGHRLQRLDLGFRGHDSADRSGAGLRHRQRHGAGVHADLRGVGGRGDAGYSHRKWPASGCPDRGPGRDRARGPRIGRGRRLAACRPT